MVVRVNLLNVNVLVMEDVEVLMDIVEPLNVCDVVPVSLNESDVVADVLLADDGV